MSEVIAGATDATIVFRTMFNVAESIISQDPATTHDVCRSLDALCQEFRQRVLNSHSSARNGDVASAHDHGASSLDALAEAATHANQSPAGDAPRANDDGEPARADQERPGTSGSLSASSETSSPDESGLPESGARRSGKRKRRFEDAVETHAAAGSEELPPRSTETTTAKKRRQWQQASTYREFVQENVGSVEGVSPLLGDEEEAMLDSITDVFEETLDALGGKTVDRQHTILKLVVYLCKIFGSDGLDDLMTLIDNLRQHDAGAVATESPFSPLAAVATGSPSASHVDCSERALVAYRKQAALGASVARDSLMRNIHRSEFSRDYEAVVEEAGKPESSVRAEVMQNHVGKKPRRETIATNFLLRRIIDDEGVTDSARATARKSLHSAISTGRLLNKMESIFGAGVFAILPSGRAAKFRGYTQDEIESVALALSRRFPQLEATCRSIDRMILRPLIYEGKSGRDVVRDLDRVWPDRALRQLPGLLEDEVGGGRSANSEQGRSTDKHGDEDKNRDE